MSLIQQTNLNSDYHLLLFFFICFNDTPSKVIKNVFISS